MQSIRYSVSIQIFFFLLVFESCVQEAPEVIDTQGSLPLLHSAVILPDTLNSDTLLVNAVRSADDTLTTRIFLSLKTYTPDAHDAVQNAMYRIQNTTDKSILAEGVLYDDGKNGDLYFRDTVFSGYAPLTFRRSLVGRFSVELWSTSSRGFQSVHLLKPFVIVRKNQPPVISDLDMPDTVDTYAIRSFKIMLKVTDPDGKDDILAVYRITQAGNKYLLNDNGVNGDIIPGNGIYTETIAWSDPSAPRSDVYKFIAIDRSLDTSNVIIHPIIVKQQ